MTLILAGGDKQIDFQSEFQVIQDRESFQNIGSEVQLDLLDTQQAIENTWEVMSGYEELCQASFDGTRDTEIMNLSPRQYEAFQHEAQIQQ